MAALTFRNRQGELVDIPAVAATRVKNEFGTILDQAGALGAVAITKHDITKAVILSLAEFQALTKGRSEPLNDLAAEFDTLLAGMQTTAARKGVESAFNAPPAALGRAAVKAAARKKR